MDVYQFAMELEMAGREHYLKLVAETPSGPGKQIFQVLADEELRHYQFLSDMSQKTQVVVDSDNVGAAEKTFYELLGKEEGLQGYMLPIDYYTQGILLEDKSIEFYREKAKTEEDPAARIFFLKLYFEEKKHKLLLENIVEVIMEPERRLESPELVRPLEQDI